MATKASTGANSVVVEGFKPSILALETSGSACSAALWRDGAVAASRFQAMRRGQSEAMVPMLQEVMTEAGQSYRDLDFLAVTRGPGGFTGVRIGLATAQGLALAWRLSVVSVTSFEAIAASIQLDGEEPCHLAVVLDAKRSEVYLQLFAWPGELRPLDAPKSLLPSRIPDVLPPGPIYLAGDAVSQVWPELELRYPDLRKPFGEGHADARWVAALAARRTGEAVPPEALRPLYLRLPDTTLPGQRGAGAL